MKESEILYEKGKYWVYENPGKSWYEVYKVGFVCSTRCAQIGKSLGMDRCIAEIDRRIAADQEMENEEV